MKKNIHIHIMGGLGNQLFQFAAARNLALTNDANLIIDKNTHVLFTWYKIFINIICLNNFKLNDISYKFQLKIKQSNNLKIANINRVFLLYRILKKILGLKKNIYEFNKFIIVDETNNFTNKKFEKLNYKKDIYLIGYFQNESYFQKNSNKICNELFGNFKNRKSKFKSLIKKLKDKKNCLIGYRFHTLKDFKKKYRNVDFEFFNKALKKVKINKSSRIFLFCYKKSLGFDLINNLKNINKKKISIISEDNKYYGNYHNLYAMSFAKKIIISSSTFYWWAAYLASKRYHNSKIICDNNFPNKKTCINNWKIK